MLGWFKQKREERLKVLDLALFPFEIGEASSPVEKALKTKKVVEEYNLCLEQDICPECGGDLNIKEWTEGFSDSSTLYTVKFCLQCKLRSEIED